ncbi:phenylacetate-CoA oxygenase/reductase subunit PaaK [Nocardia sp. NEAU-G5]|uniref:Phenylacetate-CoA oxygenase/reductase subunit PaaK n=1 Tax=Nocardia albiluteola TaxID=2842303 RepID=A0ABS6AW70_9NOCA|nr:1,2-phenylacetyl-CoA epoxidase subunit PaaE [Nocardia albiluteola]MBU3062285.1 phenylacetate-CoA oxygenase/reductase subunit PaaK [Nocardia albiluteola]
MTAPARLTPSPGPARDRRFHSLRVADVERLCDDAVAVTFDIPPKLAREFSFRAGQSLTLRRTVDGVEHRRSYSICAPVGAAPRVGVREVPGGLFSTWLVREVAAGDRIDVQPPGGAFAADPAAGGRHLLIAAGSGITPMLSIASSMLENPDTEVTLLYGNRRVGSVMFAEEIADLKDRHHARFEVVHVLSREPRDVELFSGRLDADRLRAIVNAVVPIADIDHVWLCGPHGMVTDARDVLAEFEIGRDRVHSELFYVEDAPPPQHEHRETGAAGPVSTVTLVLDGRSTTGQLPRDATILDAAERIRSDLPFACKGGVCGTCRARVTAGEVDLRRNYALEDDEVAAGFVLTCQTYPVGESITVDFDA